MSWLATCEKFEGIPEVSFTYITDFPRTQTSIDYFELMDAEESRAWI